MNLGPTVILKNDKFLRQREDERARVNKREKQRITSERERHSIRKNQEKEIYRRES